MCTGDRRTPMNPDAKANESAPTDVPPAMLTSSGKVLPTKPTVMPVRMPVRNGSKKRIGRRGIPLSIKNRLRFSTAQELSIVSLKNIIPRMSTIIFTENPCLSAESTAPALYR